MNTTVAASYKHNAPAGIATSQEISDDIWDIYTFNKHKHKHKHKTNTVTDEYIALLKARNSDPMSSFGDFIAINGTVNRDMARYLKNQVSDGIIAQNYTPEALKILNKKKKGNYIVLKGNPSTWEQDSVEFRELYGMALMQPKNTLEIPKNIIDIKCTHERDDAILGTLALKYIPSNSVTFTKDGHVVGIGCGQQNRLDCIRLAGQKALIWQMRQNPEVQKLVNSFLPTISSTEKINAIIKYIRGDFFPEELLHFKNLFEEDTKIVPFKKEEQYSNLKDFSQFTMSSDGFLPFEDNIYEAVRYNVGQVIQPGGSIRDSQIDEVCKKYGILSLKTNERIFTH